MVNDPLTDRNTHLQQQTCSELSFCTPTYARHQIAVEKGINQTEHLTEIFFGGGIFEEKK
jgi:hypothetical protein